MAQLKGTSVVRDLLQCRRMMVPNPRKGKKLSTRMSRITSGYSRSTVVVTFERPKNTNRKTEVVENPSCPISLSFFNSNSPPVRPEGDTFKGHLDSESAARPALLSRSVLGHWGHLLLHCLSLSIFLFHLSPGPSASPSPSRTQRSRRRRRSALEVPRPLLALGDQRRTGHGWPARRGVVEYKDVRRSSSFGIFFVLSQSRRSSRI